MMNLNRRISHKTWAAIRALQIQPAREAEVQAAPLQATFQAPPEERRCSGDRSLYRRLSALGPKKGMVAATINDYIREGKTLSKFELDKCVRELRKYRANHLALEIMEWMVTKCLNLARCDYAVHLDLLAKAKGIEEAEKYFSVLIPSLKNPLTYGALLNCYCTGMMEDKALALLKEMEEKKFSLTSLNFNNLMSLYMKLQQPERVGPLVERMKKSGIELSTFTYNIWMASCSHLDDIEGVERVFEELKRCNAKKCNWTIYSNLAVIYIKAGLHEKAELALRKLEEEMGPQNREAYHFLISLYGGTSNSGEVHRIWKSLKSEFEVVTNMSYLVMIQALGRCDDIIGMKKCYEEWESRCHNFDVRIPQSVIRNYLRLDKLEEAQMVLHHAKERSSGPFSRIHEAFMTFYLENNQIQQALLCMEAAVSEVNERKWHPRFEIVNEFLRCFEDKGDVDRAEEFCKLLKKVGSLQYFVYKSLLKTYIAAGKTAPHMLERIKEDGIVINTDLKNLLEKVCR